MQVHDFAGGVSPTVAGSVADGRQETAIPLHAMPGHPCAIAGPLPGAADTPTIRHSRSPCRLQTRCIQHTCSCPGKSTQRRAPTELLLLRLDVRNPILLDLRVCASRGKLILQLQLSAMRLVVCTGHAISEEHIQCSRPRSGAAHSSDERRARRGLREQQRGCRKEAVQIQPGPSPFDNPTTL